MPFVAKGNEILDVSLNTQFSNQIMAATVNNLFKENLFWAGDGNFNVPFEKHYDPHLRFDDRAHNIF